MRSLLAEPRFRRWYAAREISEAGAVATAVVLPLLTYRLTGSAALTAVVAGMEAVPYLLFGLFAGAVADRHSSKLIMIAADCFCALSLAVPLAGYLSGTVQTWHLLVAAFGISTGFAWNNAAAWGAQARIAGRDRLAAANQLAWSTDVVIGIAVPVIAGAVAAVADPVLLLAFDLATYLVSAALIASLAGFDAETPPRDTRIRTGLTFLWGHELLRPLTIAACGLSMSFGGAGALLVVHAERTLHVMTDDARIGLLFGARAVGSLAATLALSFLVRRAGYGRVLTVAYASLAAALVALALNPYFGLALVLWSLFELSRFCSTMSGITVRQLLTPDDLQGRVNTVGRMVAWGGAPVGAFAGGAIASSAGITPALLLLALPAVAALVILLRSPGRHLGDLTPATLPSP
ncbi:MFS transporter [Actinoplanes sp. NPDC051470]|uniref:MFS transporter n=1 Tax=Actinoplanes sp. NPDC051470 TaxID=3157224 RepID=UPI0034341019